MMKFDEMGALLGEKRRNLGYTQEAVAEIVGVTDKTIRNIEYSLTAPEFATVMKLWDLYGLPQEELFSFYQRSDVMGRAMDFYRNKKRKKKPRK